MCLLSVFLPWLEFDDRGGDVGPAAVGGGGVDGERDGGGGRRAEPVVREGSVRPGVSGGHPHDLKWRSSKLSSNLQRYQGHFILKSIFDKWIQNAAGAFPVARFSSANISHASNVCTLLRMWPRGLSRRRHLPRWH